MIMHMFINKLLVNFHFLFDHPVNYGLQQLSYYACNKTYMHHNTLRKLKRNGAYCTSTYYVDVASRFGFLFIFNNN
jgi:hypothetical protein